MKKAKRVSDIGAVGPPPPQVPQGGPAHFLPEPQYGVPTQNTNVVSGGYNGNMNTGYGGYGAGNPAYVPYNNTAGVPPYTQQHQTSIGGQFQNLQPINQNHQMNHHLNHQSPMGVGGQPTNNQSFNQQSTANFAMFQQPIVQDMAMQYGQQLANTGKAMVNREIEKYVPVSRLKYYFAVDTSYVVAKLKLLIFPFIHKDWSLKYEQECPVQPRYDINAPDLYIPTMAYITFVLLAGLILGTQNRFSPEQIGIQASSALAYSIFEIFVYSATLYITNIQTTLRTLDLLAYSGYKYTAIVWCLCVSFVFKRTGYYVMLLYSSLALAFFMVRTLKLLVLQIPSDAVTQTTSGGYPTTGYNPTTSGYNDASGTKRRLYFLLFVALSQPVLVWWLTFHLIPTSTGIASVDGNAIEVNDL